MDVFQESFLDMSDLHMQTQERGMCSWQETKILEHLWPLHIKIKLHPHFLIVPCRTENISMFSEGREARVVILAGCNIL